MGSIKQKMEAILLTDRSLALVEKANLEYSEQYVKDLIHANRSTFKACKTKAVLVPCLQQVILSKEIETLLEEAGLNWPVRYAQNLASDWKKVFRGCETREDALQRLKDLDNVIG